MKRITSCDIVHSAVLARKRLWRVQWTAQLEHALSLSEAAAAQTDECVSAALGSHWWEPLTHCDAWPTGESCPVAAKALQGLPNEWGRLLRVEERRAWPQEQC